MANWIPDPVTNPTLAEKQPHKMLHTGMPPAI